VWTDSHYAAYSRFSIGDCYNGTCKISTVVIVGASTSTVCVVGAREGNLIMGPMRGNSTIVDCLQSILGIVLPW